MRCVLEVVCPIVDILAHARNTEFPAVPAVPMGLFVGVTRLGLWVCGCVCGCGQDAPYDAHHDAPLGVGVGVGVGSGVGVGVHVGVYVCVYMLLRVYVFCLCVHPHMCTSSF